MRQRVIIAVVWLLAGCGAPLQPDGGTARDAATDGGRIDSGRTGGGGADASADLDDAGAPGDAGAGTCATAIAALQAELYASIGSCSVVVRLDHDSLAMLGYQVVCGSYTSVDETTARATAVSDTGFGGSMLNAASPEDIYVFYDAPGDFGGAAAVSARNGLSVFGGSIVWNGGGDLTYPDTWRPAVELASGCPAVGSPVSAVGYDLVNAGPLGATEVDAAVAVATDTAVPAAFWGGGYLFDAVVLRYPRTVGDFDPSRAEWIVVVNGGWLD